MNCPNCQNPCGENDRFCMFCGAALTQSEKCKKGTHLIPVGILTVLAIVGIVLFFLFPMQPNETPWFTVENGVLYFDESLYMGSSEITVPETVAGQTVRHISDRCFADLPWLTTVIVPDTVRSVGNQSFVNCISLRGIYLPEGLTDIGANAFYGCAAMEAINIPSTISSIGSDAFTGCEKLYYVFFNNDYALWQSLYSTHINIHTHIYCLDGSFLHR